MSISVAQGHLYGTVLEAALYGIYLILFSLTFLAFNTWHNKGRAPIVIRCVIIIMFCLSTAHLGGTIRSLQEAFFDSRPGTPEMYFNNRALSLNLLNKSLYVSNVIVGDAMMLYRLYIVSQGSLWFITLPILTLLGTGVTGFMMVWEFSRLTPGQSAFAASVAILIPACLILTFATNVIITGLIIFKILQARRRVREFELSHESSSAYQKVVANMVESGVLYPGLLMVTVILYMKKSNGQDILTGPMTQVISIVPTLMWLQVRLGFSQYDATGNRTAQNEAPAPGTIAFFHSTHGETGETDITSCGVITVHENEDVEKDTKISQV